MRKKIQQNEIRELESFFFEYESNIKSRRKMSIAGTRWQLKGLLTRSDYNGRAVTVVENLESISGRLRVQLEDSMEFIRVRPCHLASLQDANVDATVVSAAFDLLKKQTSAADDPAMAAFLGRYESGDFEGALSSAGTWSLQQPRPSEYKRR